MPLLLHLSSVYNGGGGGGGGGGRENLSSRGRGYFSGVGAY